MPSIVRQRQAHLSSAYRQVQETSTARRTPHPVETADIGIQLVSSTEANRPKRRDAIARFQDRACFGQDGVCNVSQQSAQKTFQNATDVKCDTAPSRSGYTLSPRSPSLSLAISYALGTNSRSSARVRRVLAYFCPGPKSRPKSKSDL